MVAILPRIAECLLVKKKGYKYSKLSLVIPVTPVIKVRKQADVGGGSVWYLVFGIIQQRHSLLKGMLREVLLLA